jgi:hypothetical protein
MKQTKKPTFTDVRADYVHEPRIVKPQGLVVTRDCAIKLYSMMRTQEVNKREIEYVRRMIRDELDTGRIKRYSGAGFGILSEDVFNLARWDINYPIVIMNDIYNYQDGKLKTAKLADVRETGSFCIWELGIVSHERDAWEKFLASERTEKDKIRYLDDFMKNPVINIPRNYRAPKVRKLISSAFEYMDRARITD